jgi:hypothetical protein
MKVTKTGLLAGVSCAFLVLVASEANNQLFQLSLGFIGGTIIDYSFQIYVNKSGG